MKKIIFGIVATLMVMSLYACSNDSPKTERISKENIPADMHKIGEDAKVIIKESDKKLIAKQLLERQKEFYEEHNILNEQLKDTIKELDSRVEEYNKKPSFIILQSIDSSKTEMITIEGNKERNLSSYMSYLEKRLAELLDDEFTPLMSKWNGNILLEEEEFKQ